MLSITLKYGRPEWCDDLRTSSEDGVKCEKDGGLSCLKAVSRDMYLY
jgi:hypothetical protein